MAALLCRAQPVCDHLRAQSGAEGGRNVKYRHDLGVHWSLWSRRLTDHPAFPISLHPLLFMIFHLFLTTNADCRSSQSEIHFRHRKRPHSHHFMKAPGFVLFRPSETLKEVERGAAKCRCSQATHLAIHQTPKSRSIVARFIDLLYIFLHISSWLRKKIKQICEWELLPISLSRTLKSIWILHTF